MPHVVVKLWPGKTDDQKRHLTDVIVRGVTEILDYDEDAVSVAFEEITPAQWTTLVYEAEIVGKWANLIKQPGYGDRPAGQKEEQ